MNLFLSSRKHCIIRTNIGSCFGIIIRQCNKAWPSTAPLSPDIVASLITRVSSGVLIYRTVKYLINSSTWAFWNFLSYLMKPLNIPRRDMPFGLPSFLHFSCYRRAERRRTWRGQHQHVAHHYFFFLRFVLLKNPSVTQVSVDCGCSVAINLE